MGFRVLIGEERQGHRFKLNILILEIFNSNPLHLNFIFIYLIYLNLIKKIITLFAHIFIPLCTMDGWDAMCGAWIEIGLTQGSLATKIENSLTYRAQENRWKIKFFYLFYFLCIISVRASTHFEFIFLFFCLKVEAHFKVQSHGVEVEKFESQKLKLKLKKSKFKEFNVEESFKFK